MKDLSNIDSYRAIASSSLLLKLFDNVVIYLWKHLLSTDSLQFEFKAGFSTTECTWLVMEVASYYLRRGTSCILTLLDCSKAFDTCQFSTLFQNFMKRSCQRFFCEHSCLFIKSRLHRSNGVISTQINLGYIMVHNRVGYSALISSLYMWMSC